MANFKGNKSNMLSLEVKIEVAKDWAVNQQGWKKLAKKHNVSYYAARKWTLGYEEYGIEYLKKISSRKGQTAGIKKIDIELKNNPFRKEILELKRKNKLLEMDNEILKKVQSIPGGFRKKQQLKYNYIEKNKSDWSIIFLCKALKTAQSSYYRWVKKRKALI